MKRWTNKATFLMIVGLLLTFLVGSSTVWSAESASITHIIRAGVGEAAINHLNAMIERFEAENPGTTVELMVVPGYHEEQFIAMYAGGTSPDVVDTYPDQNYFLALDGMFADLNPIVDRDPEASWSDFPEFVVNGITIPDGVPHAGARWLLPEQLQVIAAGFNHEAFDSAGLTPPSTWDHQWTWDDLVEMGQKLHRVDGEGNVLQAGAEIRRAWSRWPVWVHNAGGWHFDRYVDPSQSHLTSEPVVTAMQFLQDLFTVHEFVDERADFRRGRSAIGLSVGPSHSALHRQYGNTWDYSFGPNPMNVRGGSEVSIYGRSISSQSKNVDLAWEWMKYLTFESAEEMVRNASVLPAWIPALRQYSTWASDGAPQDSAWPEILLRADNYTRQIMGTDVRDGMQEYFMEITDGTQSVRTGLEQAHEVVTGLLAERHAKN